MYNHEVTVERLKHALQALAAPADAQLSLFPDFAHKVDELALDFNHWCDVVVSNAGSALTDHQRLLLEQLDDQLETMSGSSNADLCTELALRKRPEWEQVRILARAVLVSFGWSGNRPPSYTHEFAPG
jgi:hypothetical protein